MGPPIDHGAFPVPDASGFPQRVGQERATSSLFWAIVSNRFEELNNYSGRMTRRKYDDLAPIADNAEAHIRWVTITGY
jgi:hypothetical protein